MYYIFQESYELVKKILLQISSICSSRTLSQVNRTQSPNNCLSEVSYTMEVTLNTKLQTGIPQTFQNKPNIRPYVLLPTYLKTDCYLTLILRSLMVKNSRLRSPSLSQLGNPTSSQFSRFLLKWRVYGTFQLSVVVFFKSVCFKNGFI